MKKIILILLILAISPSAFGEIKTKTIDYSYGGITMKGHLAWDDSIKEKRPGVLVVHEWWGLNDYAKKRAEQLAKLGYVALAADMYGEGKATQHSEDASKMAEAVRSNIEVWRGRANAALQVLRNQPLVDNQRLAAIGYCFGGATVLQLAYSGADLKAVVSFHGPLPVPETTDRIKAKILILHGADDPHVPADSVQKLRAKLDQGKVPYQFISYPGAGHGFTVPEAGKTVMKGVAYNAEADKLSWQEMMKLFNEVFK